MSVTDVSSITCAQNSDENLCVNRIIPDNFSSVENVSKVEGENEEEFRCFVCDVRVQGRSYALATCKTQHTRARVVEKLGDLVGKRYLVVISEDDVICRSCATLINKLDKLESQMKVVKRDVLRFLERKYSLPEGELVRYSELPRLGQPPQITRNNGQGDFLSQKRGLMDFIDASCVTKRSKKSHVLMQCDKCRYTTTCDTFLVHHVRQRLKKNINCDKCGLHFLSAETSDHRCKDQQNENSVETEPTDEEPRAIQTAPLETIDLAGNGEDVDEDVTSIPVVSIPADLEVSMPSKDEQIQLINLTNPNTLPFQHFFGNDAALRDGQPLFMRVFQQFGVGDDLDQSSLMPVMNNDTMIRSKENSAKQILTIAEDGSLEMVAIDCWNEENPTDRDPEPNL